MSREETIKYLEEEKALAASSMQGRLQDADDAEGDYERQAFFLKDAALCKEHIEMLDKEIERHKRKLAKGFTLVELMIVVLILGILAAVAVPLFMKLSEARKCKEDPTMCDEKMCLRDCAKLDYPGNQKRCEVACKPPVEEQGFDYYEQEFE